MSRTFFVFFEHFFNELSNKNLIPNKRRKRDLNPRAAINDLLPFQGSPFSLLGISPCVSTIDIIAFIAASCQVPFSTFFEY